MTSSGTSLTRRLPLLLLALAAALSAALSFGAVAAHATTPGEIAVTDEGPNRLDLWTDGPNDHIWQRTYTTSAGWADWVDFGAPPVGAASEPEVIHIPANSGATQAGKYYMFVRGTDDAMWMRVFSPSTGWGSWTSAGGSYASGFHAAYSSGGDWIDVVGRDKATNNLTWRVINQGTWTGINTRTAATLNFTPAVLDWTPSGQAPRADVFAVGSSDNSIWTATNQNLQWGAWQGLNGTATSAASAAFGNGASMVAVRGFNGQQVFANTNTGGGWQGWANLDGNLGTGPTIHYWQMADSTPRWWVVGREPGNPTPGARPPQIVMNEKVGSAAWKGWAGVSATPDAEFYGVSTQFGGADGQIDTDDEVARAVAEIRGSTPQGVQTLIAGIRPGAERDAVNAALAQSDIDATVAVTHDGANQLDLWTGQGGLYYRRTWISGQGWNEWQNLGGPDAGSGSAPDVIRTPDGRYRVFVIAADHKLYMHMYYPNGFPGHGEGWTGWTLVSDGPYTGGVQAAYSNGGDWIDVVTRQANTNQLVWQHWNGDSAGWQAPDVRPDGVLSGTPSIVDWTKSGAPQADVFAKGEGNWVFTSTNQNLAWTAWGNMNGQATSPVDGAAGDGRVVLTFRGDDSRSAYGSTYLPDSGWGSWTNLHGNLSSGPTTAYWPDQDNNPRWELIARDGGVLSGGRPGQIIRDERLGSDSPWGGWVGISSVPRSEFYGTSVQFGGDDGAISAQSEIDAAVQAIRDADSMVADSLLAGITPAQRDAVWQAAFPTSWQYGDEVHHSVTTAAQIDNVIDAFNNAGSDTAAQSILDGLTKDNLARVIPVLKSHIADDNLVRDISDGAVYSYRGGTVYPVSGDFAGQAGINLGSAKRVPHSVLTSWTMGSPLTYSTSWTYGGADHSVNTDDEVASALAAVSADWDGLWNGLSPADQAALQQAISNSSLEVGSVSDTAHSVAPTDDQLVELGMTPTEAGTATAAGVGPFCASPLYHTVPLEWWARGHKIATVGKAVLTSGFCYSRGRHTASWDHYQLGLDVHIDGFYDVMWSGSEDSGAPMPYQTSWGGHDNGGVIIKRYYHTKYCSGQISHVGLLCKTFNKVIGVEGVYNGDWYPLDSDR
jgi:hypothetical protein